MDAGKGLAWKGGAPDEMINEEVSGAGTASAGLPGSAAKEE